MSPGLPAEADDGGSAGPSQDVSRPQIFPTSTVVPPEDQYEGDTSEWPLMALAALVPVLLFGGFIIPFRRQSRPRE